MCDLREVGRRLADEHRDRRGAARTKRWAHTGVGGEQLGPSSASSSRAKAWRSMAVKSIRCGFTALAILAVEDDRTSRCSSIARTARYGAVRSDVDEAFIRSAGAIVVTGTHFSKPGPAAAQKKAIRIARAAGAGSRSTSTTDRTFGGLRPRCGENRYIRSDTGFGASAEGAAGL